MAKASTTALASRLDHRFAQPALLDEALTHPSATTREGTDFERLEFLGDRVLGVIIAHQVLRRTPQAPAGVLARQYNHLVRRETLAQIAQSIDLGRFMRLSAGERSAGGAGKPTILADVCEAVIGALYLDGGLAAAERFVLRHWASLLDEVSQTGKDAKTALQEWAQARTLPPPRYVVVDTDGPPHDVVFRVQATLPGWPPAEGSGKSKRGAEQEAAEALMRQIDSQGRR